MLSLKLVRSLVLGETTTIYNSPSLLLNQNHNRTHHNLDNHHDDDGDDDDDQTRRTGGKKNNMELETTPLLLFLPTREIVKDTYRLATIARDMGMDLNPTPSLSHMIFSWPSSSSSSSSLPSLWSSSSSTWTLLSSDAVPLPFPSLRNASTTHLRCFVSLSKGLFKLVFYKSNPRTPTHQSNDIKDNNWDCSSLNLYATVTGHRIDTMESFSRVLTGMGWTLFNTKHNPSLVSVPSFSSNNPISMYLFRKLDSSRLRLAQSSNQSGELRIRELRLPCLDFRNAPLRILHYILLMTDNLFYLA